MASKGIGACGAGLLVALAAACGGETSSRSTDQGEAAGTSSGGAVATGGRDDTGGDAGAPAAGGSTGGGGASGGDAGGPAAGGTGGTTPGTIPPDWTDECEPSEIGPCGGQSTIEAEAMTLTGATVVDCDWAFGGAVVVVNAGDTLTYVGYEPTGDDCTLIIAYQVWEDGVDASALTVGPHAADTTPRTVTLPLHDPSSNGLQYGLIEVPFSTGSVWTVELTGAGPTVAIDRFALRC
ncbi:MAG: hypothetical protein JW751_27100 [Polyangiaceae bacterium]|nr:hypothetical protein [Polyangiaceae bacterium]